MDLGLFAEEVVDAVAGLCGDAVVETHGQAANVLDALCRRPGASERDVAAVLGLSLEQLARSREARGARSEQEEQERRRKDPVWADICQSDAVYTWNVLIQRINQAAHWREEFRELANAGDNDGDSSAEEADVAIGAMETVSGEVGLAKEEAVVQASQQTRQRARELLGRHLEPAAEPLRRALAERLEAEVFELCPGERDYRHCTRSISANLRRNSMLAAGYATGRVPPQWIVLADAEALAPRLRQLQRRVLRAECLKEVREDDESAELRRKMWDTARAAHLAPAPPLEDPTA